MQAAEEQAAIYDGDLENTLADCVARGDLEPLFEPVVDPAARQVVGYRSSVRGPFYSPLRLPDVLLDVARRSRVLASYGIAAREATVTAAAGLRPDDLLFLGCAAGRAAQRRRRRRQRVLLPEQGAGAAARGVRDRRRRPRDQHCLHAAHARRRARPRLPALHLGAGGAVHSRSSSSPRRLRTSCASTRCWSPDLGVELTPVEVVQLLVRFAGRTGAQLIATGVRDAGAAPAARAQRGRALLRRGVRARRHAAAAGDVPGVSGPRTASPVRPFGCAQA